jgi:hypothetical protein
VNARPFKTWSEETAPVGTIELVAYFSSAGHPTESGLALARRLMTHFVTVAAHGGLADTYVPPTESTLSLAAEQYRRDLLAWRFEAVRVSPGIRTVLENLMQSIHVNVAPLSESRLSVPAGSELARLSSRPANFRVPPPFEYLFEPEDAEVVIDAEFAARVEDDNKRRQFVQFWESWVYVSGMRGFDDADAAFNQPGLYPSGEPESHADEVAMFMEDVSVDERAFDVLVNGFHRLHYVAAPLGRLHIY